MPEEIRNDLEIILDDLREMYDHAEGGVATLTTKVGARYQGRVERVSQWLDEQD